ncbi:MAG TPA: hypothetical protein VK933_05200 [Longimicrobiales bacterium]|nr:hypothetical protein [Longimicrobiales bacterium]
MYSTCLFCNSDLGRNEALYDFPVGRRLAFDGRKGRLWVVCRRCERWNLTPLEERWEAIEQAERQFGSTRQRVSTEHIGLSRLPDGTELVRIGAPLRPEFAAWRYGDQFGRRRRRRMLIAGGGLGAFGALIAGGAMAGVSIAAFGGLIINGITSIVNGSPDEVVANLRTDSIGTVAVRRRHLAETQLLRGADAPLALDLRFKGGAARVEGAEALRIAGQLMPHVNRFGAKPEIVKSAVATLDSSGGAEAYLERLSSYAPAATHVVLKGNSRKRKPQQSGWMMAYTSGLFGLKHADRLALEMALHEDVEMRALQGELHTLERAWRDAEEIAAIADGILTPSPMQSALNRLRRLGQ